MSISKCGAKISVCVRSLELRRIVVALKFADCLVLIISSLGISVQGLTLNKHVVYLIIV